MGETPPAYRREGDHVLIELRLDSPQQLFDNRDPAPFHDKDLDPAAVAYITEAAMELPPEARLALVVHLPPSAQAGSSAPDIAVAVSRFFGREAATAKRALHTLLADGRLALVIGFTFLAACLGLVTVLTESGVDFGWPGRVLAEGLVIIGWVALWRPVEIFLYDWWPLLRRARLLQRLVAMPVELRSDT
jgi:hypothetical protein